MQRTNFCTKRPFYSFAKPKLSTTKTVSAVFHLNNKEAKRELKVNHNNKTLPFCFEPKYLGVMLDRSLTYRRHLDSIRKKLTSRVAHLMRFSVSGWDSGATALRIATSALVHSTAEYCAPVWSHSPYRPHYQRRLANCDWMHASYTSGQPSYSCRHPTCWASSQWSHTVSSTPCHGAWTPAPLSAHLSTKHPFVLAAQQRISRSDNNNVHAGHWADHQWKAERLDNLTSSVLSSPTLAPTLPEWSSQKEPGSGSTASALVSDVSAPAHTNGTWPPLRPVTVAQKNKPSTMLSSNVQSIDLPMDCMAWRFWTMKQPNGCSTPAPRFSAAKQWIEGTAAQTTKNSRNREALRIIRTRFRPKPSFVHKSVWNCGRRKVPFKMFVIKNIICSGFCKYLQSTARIFQSVKTTIESDKLFLYKPL